MTGPSDGGKLTTLPRVPRQAVACVAVSALYIWAYFVTATLVMPLQQALFPSTIMSFLFLPHGVRVLAAWLYGWRSILFLLPGALLCNLHFAGDRAFDRDILFGTAASLIAAPLAFAIGRSLGGAALLRVGVLRAPTLVALGIAASVFNLLALRLSYGLKPSEGVVILIGDTLGLVTALVIVWLGLKLLARRA